MVRKVAIELNIKSIIIQHVLVIAVGLAIFYIDEIEFLDKFYPKLILILMAIVKSVYFIGHSFKKIEEASVKNHTYNKFLIIIITNIFLIIVSFTIDYACLNQFDKSAFKGMVFQDSVFNSVFDFLYFSVLTFTTTGFGDIIPITRSAKALVTMEVIVAFITTIIVISNFVHIKDSIHDLNFLKIKKRFVRDGKLKKNGASDRELVEE